MAAFLPLFLFACSSSGKIVFVNAPIKIESISATINNITVDSMKRENDDAKTDSFLTSLLHQYPQYFDAILKNRKNWNVQVIYTQVNRDKNNRPSFTDYYFNVDSTQYFYPASTVKLPTALLALQRLHELSSTGIDRNTSMITGEAYSGQTATYNDPQTADGRPTIESYVKRILLVSDNEAFNRLYEFLGQKYINYNLHRKGYDDAQIIHRLEVSLSDDENRHTNPVTFLDSNNNVLYSQPLVYNSETYAERHDTLGNAYYSNGYFVNHPMDFSKKNRLSLPDLHSIIRSAIFPESVDPEKRFDLTQDDYDFVHKYMSGFPSESVYPAYDTAEYNDAFVKFLLYGSQKEPLPKNIRIFNKVCDAYGQLIDAAYIIDLDKNIEFFLSATIYCNSNGILNDDTYDYETIGLPFMKNLGQVIYDYESKRKKKNEPDLSSFKIEYDKY